MNLTWTQTWLDRIRQEAVWRSQFGPTETQEQIQAAQQRYQSWLNTPQATAEILRDPWKAELSWAGIDTRDDPDGSRLRQLLKRLKLHQSGKE